MKTPNEIEALRAKHPPSNAAMDEILKRSTSPAYRAKCARIEDAERRSAIRWALLFAMAFGVFGILAVRYGSSFGLPLESRGYLSAFIISAIIGGIGGAAFGRVHWTESDMR